MEAALCEAGVPADRASQVASALPKPLPTDKRLLMDGLKQAGVDKMGQRLKAAALLLATIILHGRFGDEVCVCPRPGIHIVPAQRVHAAHMR